MVSTAVGFLCTMIGLLSNGTFASIVKMPRVAKCNMPPITFVFFLSLGVATSSFLSPALFPAINPDAKLLFSWYGVLAGALFVGSSVFSFFAIPAVGLALAQGLWGGAALVVSFLWGVAAFGDKVDSIALAVLSLVLLLAGVAGIALCEDIAAAMCRRKSAAANSDLRDTSADRLIADARRSSMELESGGSGGPGSASGTHGGDGGKGKDSGGAGEKNLLVGIACACGVGVCGGSILAPTHYAPADVAGIAFVPSFGIGVLVAGIAVYLTDAAIHGRIFRFESKADMIACLIGGMVSGAWWNVGNVCAVYGIEGLGYAVAYSLVQCALFVSGLMGIVVFKEVQGYAIAVFFTSGTVLILGAVLLASYA